jgi:hypothetical protein
MDARAMPLNTTDDYERACRITRELIDEWDPYSLLASGAPADEFEPAAAAIVVYVPKFRSAEDAVQAVSEVFSARFEPEYFSPQHCRIFGEKLFYSLRSAGLLTSQD